MTKSQFKPLAGKVALITGGSRGLGRAMAVRLADDGALVAINYRSDDESAVSAVAEIATRGGQAFAVKGDVSRVAGIEALYKSLDTELTARTGETAIDVLIPNAGISRMGTIEETREDDFDLLFDTNVKGVYFLIARGLSRLRDGGRIITLSSGLTRFSYPTYPAYSITKGAIDVLTQVLAKQLGARGITVNAVAPGAIDTDFNASWIKSEQAQAHLSSIAALGRVGKADDISGVVAFLASDDSRWVTAQRVEASGGAYLG